MYDDGYNNCYRSNENLREEHQQTDVAIDNYAPIDVKDCVQAVSAYKQGRFICGIIIMYVITNIAYYHAKFLAQHI